MKKLFVISLIFAFFSYCARKNNNISEPDIELFLLNDSIVYFCPKGDKGSCSYNADYYFYMPKRKIYKKKSFNRLRFKITNNTPANYVLGGLAKNFGLNNDRFQFNSLVNFELQDITNSKVKSFQPAFFPEITPVGWQQLRIADSVYLYGYKKLYPANDKGFLSIRKQLVETTVLLPAHSSLYFETFINLPLNDPAVFVSEDILLEKNKPYQMRLKFTTIDTTRLKRFLPWNIKQTIKENNYVFYTDILRSNWVPVKFVE